MPDSRALPAIRNDGRVNHPETVSPAPRGRGPFAVALPGAQPIGDAGVAGAIGEAVDRAVAAEPEIHGAGFADRPAALGLAQLEQRAFVRALDRRLVPG